MNSKNGLHQCHFGFPQEVLVLASAIFEYILIWSPRRRGTKDL